ncbi:hypothetical protein SASPL_154456 [Salvia splendens]|uniref:Uncharacterized protein n=1 Tax=Salvia splendens TaxID=180675 RepID=A0A8X8W033_SALSN|nr:hypothetical protein SASPL_154456 [Salvia splendens]
MDFPSIQPMPTTYPIALAGRKRNTVSKFEGNDSAPPFAHPSPNGCASRNEICHMLDHVGPVDVRSKAPICSVGSCVSPTWGDVKLCQQLRDPRRVGRNNESSLVEKDVVNKLIMWCCRSAGLQLRFDPLERGVCCQQGLRGRPVCPNWSRECR